MIMQLPLLSVLIFLPIAAALLILFVGEDEAPDRSRYIALVTLAFSTLICAVLVGGFDCETYAMQFTETVEWLPSFGIRYQLGIDGISLPLIILTTFSSLIVLFATWYSIKKNVAQYLANILVLQGLLMGVFAALDSILFYIFWEATLIPMYLIIGMWGSANRVYASIKFFIYTFFGSAMMLIALLYLGFKANDFSILSFYPLKLDMTAQILIFIAFFLAFAIKVPMWPVHTWLPDAHTEAPAGGSIILAAVLLKLGGYGFLRFSLPMVPDASQYFSTVIVALSLIAVIYIALVALVQTDMKRLIAYSSISHMGFATLGFFLGYLIQDTDAVAAAGLGFEGGMVVMISHGFISGALFAGVGYMYDRLHTRDIQSFGGVLNAMPIFGSLFILFALANAGLPGTSGFVGEFMVILGAMKATFWIAFLAALTLILGAAYTLWMVKRVIFGAVENKAILSLQDIQGFEMVAFVMLALAVLFIGFYPAPLVDLMHSSSGHILSLSQVTKL